MLLLIGKLLLLVSKRKLFVSPYNRKLTYIKDYLLGISDDNSYIFKIKISLILSRELQINDISFLILLVLY